MITHSLGELDVIFPILSKIYNKNAMKIELIFTEKKIYHKFISNNFYQYISNNFDINFSLNVAYKLKSLQSLDFLKKNIVFIKNIVFLINNFFNGIFLLRKVYSNDYFMHEFTNQLTSTWILYFSPNFFKYERKIIVYMHGHAIHYDAAPSHKKKTKFANKVKALIFHEHSEIYWKKRGFTNLHILGYPKFFKEWFNLVNAYSANIKLNKKFVLIYTRDIHPYYMDKEKYIELLTTSCQIINSKFKEEIEIIIKPHPRESNDFIIKVLNDSKIKNFKIMQDYNLVFSELCVLAISFWTSAILDAMCSGTPAIEYYIEADRFREVEPKGSLYKDIGIISVDNKNDLNIHISNLEQVKNNNDSVLKKISKNSNVNFL